MNSLYDFIVKPLGERYNNNIKLGDKNLILNTKIENFKAVNRLAEIISVPLAYSTKIKKGDIAVVHQNIFRVFYDIRGNKKNSRSLFKDDLYFCAIDQIYLYKNSDGWNSFGDRCFVMPLKNTDALTNEKERKLIGVLKYDNSVLNASGISSGDVVGFTPNSEWEFIIEGERLYCMKSNDIVIKYGHQGDEVVYNPSWAQSC